MGNMQLLERDASTKSASITEGPGDSVSPDLSQIRAAEKTKRKRFLIAVLTLTLVQNAYPIYQAISTGGYLYYINAWDETSYLQYDFSKAGQSLTRISQFVVTAGHEFGLSGGWINFLFDIVLFPVVLIAARGCFLQLDITKQRATECAIIVGFLPLAFGGFNPIVSRLFTWNLTSGMIYWFTVPEAFFLPFVRSPEPQFSLAVLSCCAWLSLRRRSFLFVYLCLPFLYPFVAVPTAFIVVSLHIHHRFRAHRWSNWAAPMAAFGLITCGMWIHLHTLIPHEARMFLAETRLPLLSFTFLLGAIVAWWGHRRCPREYRFLVWILAIAPLFAANHQIVTGLLGVPNAYEQYVGVICVALIAIFVVRSAWLTKVLVCVSLLLAFGAGLRTVRANLQYAAQFQMGEELLESLRVDSGKVAINNIVLAQMSNMLFPRQPPTLLGYEKSYAALCSEDILREYRCARQTLLDNPETAPHFQEVIDVLDTAYRYQGADFVLVHVGRRTEFQSTVPEFDEPLKCEDRNLHIVILDDVE